MHSGASVNTSKEEIILELKPILVDIRLLQHTCHYFDYAHRRPEKYIYIKTLEEAQNIQQTLIPKMNALKERLTGEEWKKVVAETDSEVEVLLELQEVEMVAGKLDKTLMTNFLQERKTHEAASASSQQRSPGPNSKPTYDGLKRGFYK